jgi:hypothetical protein
VSTTIGRFAVGTADRDRAEAADLCCAGTGLRFHGMRLADAAVVNQAEALSSKSSKSSVLRHRARRSPVRNALSSKRFFHHRRLASPATRSPVRETLCVPRFSGATGQSKKVMSLPGVASRPRRTGDRRWCRPGSPSS